MKRQEVIYTFSLLPTGGIREASRLTKPALGAVPACGDTEVSGKKCWNSSSKSLWSLNSTATCQKRHGKLNQDYNGRRDIEIKLNQKGTKMGTS
jgi:hypothetical protein